MKCAEWNTRCSLVIKTNILPSHFEHRRAGWIKHIYTTCRNHCLHLNEKWEIVQLKPNVCIIIFNGSNCKNIKYLVKAACSEPASSKSTVQQKITSESTGKEKPSLHKVPHSFEINNMPAKTTYLPTNSRSQNQIYEYIDLLLWTTYPLAGLPNTTFTN